MSNITLIRFQTPAQVNEIIRELTSFGYEMTRIGHGSVAFFDGDTVVFSASRLESGRMFCRANPEYMSDGVISVV